MILNVNRLNSIIMAYVDGEIPAIYFLITSFGFIVLLGFNKSAFEKVEDINNKINTLKIIFILKIITLMFCIYYY